MEVKTKIGTTVQVDEKHLLEMPEGLFGFEEYTHYAVFESEYPPFMWMQSTDEEHLAFLLIDPFLIVHDYEIDIDDKALSKIGVSSPKDVHIMAIVTIPADGKPVTANLLGPIVINRENGKSMQVIINDNRWSTKYDIVKALKAVSASSSAGGC